MLTVSLSKQSPRHIFLKKLIGLFPLPMVTITFKSSYLNIWLEARKVIVQNKLYLRFLKAGKNVKVLKEQF